MRSKTGKGPTIGFLFSPQVAPYPRMGMDFYTGFPAYAAVFDVLAAVYGNLTGKSLLAEVESEDSSIHEPDVAGPLIFATEIALAELLSNFGVKPYVVLGHSFGEYAAAVTSGVLSLEDAMRLVVGRAELVKSRLPYGCLTSLIAEVDIVKQLVADFATGRGLTGGGLDVAAVNGPHTAAVGGQLAEIEAFEDFCAHRGIKFTRVKAPKPYAYHTRAMDPIMDDLGALAATLTHAQPRVPFVSCSTGQEEVNFGQKYWQRLTRNTVQFAEAFQTFAKMNLSLILEVGPRPLLTTMVGRNFQVTSTTAPMYSIMNENEDCVDRLLKVLCSVSLAHVAITWTPWIDADLFRLRGGGGPYAIRVETPRQFEVQKISAIENLSASEVELDISFCSLNYVDKGIFHRVETKARLGFDFSGTVRRVGHDVTKVQPGDQVYGLSLTGGALASSLTLDQNTVAKVPPCLSLAAAATVPLSYTIAWHALVELGGVGKSPSARILVNLSRGWIGMPLIQIAHHFGAEVYALTSSQERTDFLRSAGVKHIYDLSNHMDFVAEILHHTTGQGLTVVLNNFEADVLKNASLDLVSHGGRFVDIAPAGHWTADQVAAKRADVQYSVLEFSSQVKRQMTTDWPELTSRFESGVLASIPFASFPIEALAEVFDWFDAGKLGLAKPLIQIA